jgi:hypothetical protein
MLEWILLGMTADLVYTSRKKRVEAERQQEIMKLRARLRTAMTRGHTKQCKCRLCHNRRQTLEAKFSALM